MNGVSSWKKCRQLKENIGIETHRHILLLISDGIHHIQFVVIEKALYIMLGCALHMRP